MAAKKKTAAKKAPAKKKATKKKAENVQEEAAPIATKVRAVRDTGEVSLENGIKLHCAVGRHGPVVKKGDMFVKTKDGWERKK
jgi:hypothetical protein